jgi:GntR family transcriptional regulator, rspAB operon transcriptional repressor
MSFRNAQHLSILDSTSTPVNRKKGKNFPPSLVDYVYNHVFKQIANGVLKPGTRLRIQELSNTLEISDTPVREAFQRLEHNGFLEKKPRAEHRIRLFTRNDIEELYDLREALECFSIKRAILDMPDEDLHQLEELFNEAERALDHEEMGPYIKADEEMHGKIVQNTNNSQIFSLFMNILGQIRMFRHLGARTSDIPRRFLEIHRQILKALLNRDAAGAIRLMEEHTSEAKEQAIKDYLESYGE